MSVEKVNQELDGVRQGVADAPFMNLTKEQLDKLSLGDALQAMQELIGVVRQRQEEYIPIVAATIPATRSVVRDSAEHVGYVVPLGMDGPHPAIEGVQTALFGTEQAMSAAGEYVLTMAHSTQQALGQLSLAIGNITDYEGARRQLLDGVADIHAGRDLVNAGLQAYQTSITGR